jgi:hypothetical protein
MEVFLRMSLGYHSKGDLSTAVEMTIKPSIPA